MCLRQQAAWTEVWLGLPCPGAGADGPATNAAHSAAAAAKGALFASQELQEDAPVTASQKLLLCSCRICNRIKPVVEAAGAVTSACQAAGSW